MAIDPDTSLMPSFEAAGLRDGLPVGVLCSGGLDSAVLLAELAARGPVVPFYVACGLAWETAEFDAVERLLAVLDRRHVRPVVRLSMPTGDLYGDHWSISGTAVPDAASCDEAVELPGRNALLAIKPLLWCAAHGVGQLALATLAGNPFADASAEFLLAFAAAISQGSAATVSLVAPFRRLSKAELIRASRPEVLAASLSCLAPQHDGGRWWHCGRCNKCAERSLGFRRAGVVDPALSVGGLPPRPPGLPG